MSIERLKSGSRADGYVGGQMLVAMPTIGDERFHHTVIFMCAHAREGAWGLIVNRPARGLAFPDLLVQLELIGAPQAQDLPQAARDVLVLRGGPVERGRGFMLHSPDWRIEGQTIDVGAGMALTATTDILRAVAHGEGPARAALALGYAGWAPGQLDNELQANGWLTCEADESFVFDRDQNAKYERALRSIGVDPAMLSGEAGHA